MNNNANSPLHTHALAALEAADIALAHAPLLDISDPHRAEDITPESLTAMLACDVAGARVERIEVADAHDGMTTRNKLNVYWNAAGQQANLPSQVFVKVTPDGPYLRETLALLHMAEQEVRFYNEIQPEVPELAPKAYYAKSYQGGRFMILMEVLEARGLKPYWQAYDCSLQHAKAVVATLAKLHATYWESPRFNTDLVWVRPRSYRFGLEWHQRSLNLAREQFLETDICAALPNEIIETIRLLNANDRKVLAYWDTLPATLLHGDSHLGNTFSYPDGRAGFFDWQVIYRGYGLREIAYFFLSAIDNDVRKKHEREVVDYYLDQLESHGVSLDRKAAWQNYSLFALDQLDANIKTTMRGGYGHAASALKRGLETAVGAMLEHGVPELLQRVVRDGKL